MAGYRVLLLLNIMAFVTSSILKESVSRLVSTMLNNSRNLDLINRLFDTSVKFLMLLLRYSTALFRLSSFLSIFLMIY